MRRFLEGAKVLGFVVVVLAVCYYGCYRKIDSYSDWAKYEYKRLTDSEDPLQDAVFLTSYDMDAIYEDYLEILNSNDSFGVRPYYDVGFTYEIRTEDRVSEHIPDWAPWMKPVGKSIVFKAPFRRCSVLGLLYLGDQIFDLEGYVAHIEGLMGDVDDISDVSPWDYTVVSFLRTQFDYIYLVYEEDGRTVHCFDVQEVLWREDG